MTTPLKRKHVSFTEDTAPAPPPTTANTPHPSRLANIAGLPQPISTYTPAPIRAKKQKSTEPKEKTVSKKRYLHKKAQKRKILVKARKDAAPKNKSLEGITEVSDQVDAAEKVRADEGLDGMGVASSSKALVVASMDENVEEDGGVVFKRKKEKKGKGKEKAVGDVTPVPTQGAEEKAAEEEDGEVDEAVARQRRKAEKRAKREQRDHEAKKLEKQKRIDKAKRALERVEKARSTVTVVTEEEIPRILQQNEEQKEDVDMSANGDSDSDEEDDTSQDGEGDESVVPERKQSPIPLEPFPLPQAPPAPSASLLARQGLPAGLKDADLVDQTVTIPIRDLMTMRRGKLEKGINESMVKKLEDMGINTFFAVQAAILPYLLSPPLVPTRFDPLPDHLISAPTGSGKTLSYAIPLIQLLSTRTVTRLRALIVLPTKDLVVQVRETLEALAKGTKVKVASVTGQHSFAHEQTQLVGDTTKRLLGGSSKVDILIATPGRLIDHLNSTQNFTLQHLRFLVIDEADRLLNQSYQNWLPTVLRHARPPEVPEVLPADFESVPWDSVSSAWMESFGLANYDDCPEERPQATCQKLLFSATLTRDPAAIASLNLNNPTYTIITTTSSDPAEQSDPTLLGTQFTLPATLSENYLVVSPESKPLNLINLLHSSEYIGSGVKETGDGEGGILVFTKSVESVGKLVRLIEEFEGVYVGGKGKVVVKGYSGDMKAGEKKGLLADFASGKITMLICSDLISRGMDLPTVSHVISYDTPLDMRKYVHRVGRTARAGRQGTAWTLVEKQEAAHFKRMMRSAGHEDEVTKVKVKDEDLQVYKETYEATMRRLKVVYGGENQ